MSVFLGAFLIIAVIAAALLGRAYHRSDQARRDLAARLQSLAASEDHERTSGHDRLQALGAALAGIAHDLNSALSVVVMNLDLLQQDRAPAEGHTRRVEAMRKAMEKATRLTRHLLRLAHRQEPEMDVVCLAELMPSLVELLQAALGKSMAIETRVAPDLWPTQIDVAAFDTAALHLALATAGAMQEPERLTIELRNGDGGEADRGAADGHERGEHVLLVMACSGASARGDKAPREPAADDLFVRGPGFAAVERFAVRCGGHLSIAPIGESALRAALYLPRCRETTTV